MNPWQMIVLGSMVAWGVGTTGVAADLLTLSQPMSYQVVQRDDRNQGRIPIQGTCSGTVSRVEACYESMGSPPVRWLWNSRSAHSAWASVSGGATNGIFVGSLSVPAGGWYRIVVRALDGEKEIARQVVSKVGVGEVFLMAGQSNAGNFGWPWTAPVEDRVVTPCQWCKNWRCGYDPQPWAHGGTGGSPWPALGDGIVKALNVPVALIPVAAGGTTVSNWVPSSQMCYPNLKRAIDFVGPHGARAILWHQGESDAFEGTSADVYAARLTEVIVQSRKDAGWDIPWGVAQAGFVPANLKLAQGTNHAANAAVIREGQKKVCLIPGVFEGATTDDLTGPEWRHDTIHLNGRGLREHGRRWAVAVLKNLFSGVATNASSAVHDAMAFVSPGPGYVAQRDAQGRGDVPVIGVFDGALSRIEGRWISMTGGDPSPWAVVAENPKDGIIGGTLRMPAGWYRLELRGLRNGKPVVERSIERVGVGEVFVVVGGETVANYGRVPQTAKDPRVSSHCLVCHEVPMCDPMRGAVGDGGSSWPAMGDALAVALDLPVEIVAVGYSGSIEQWKPGSSMYGGGILSTLAYTRRFTKGTYRAVLWEVGELDAKVGTTATNYTATLGTIITQVRKDAGWEMPWVIAGAAYHPEASATNQAAVREAQRLACDGKTILDGPTADDLTGPNWRFDGIHFTEAGLQEHGKRWAAALQTLFFKEKRP